MQTPLLGMAPRPSPLLRKSASAVVQIGMVFNLSDRCLMKQLLLAVMVRPSDKFDRRTLVAINHVAVRAFRA